MFTERVILCGGVGDAKLPVDDRNPLRLRMWGPHSNVHLKIQDVRESMYTDVPAAFLDLIDIAVYVYCADQAVRRRGGGSVDGDRESPEIGQNWRRSLHFRIPVRNPDLWNSDCVHRQLVSTLSFLTEDEYHFDFEHLLNDAPLRGYLDFGSTPYDGVVEEVMLFSGGLDSLAGAVKEAIVDQRNVLLVNHRSNGKDAPRHAQLLERLRRRAQEHPPQHLSICVNKQKRFSREFTQRSRSFVYASLAATIATMIGLNRIRSYENGVVSLNLPPSPQVVGTRASRTTHPQVLNGYARLLSCLAGKPFVVENPFLWKTKTEVVNHIADAGCGELIRYSSSCAHTWERTKQHSHCGLCSQCVDRRFAVLAAGQDGHDPAEAYQVDLLLGERPTGVSKTMLAAYLETANQISLMSAAAFFSRYGEATRVLRQFDSSPDVTAMRIFDLYKLHAKQVTGVVDQAIKKNPSAIRTQSLPAGCLLRIVCDLGDGSGKNGVLDSPEYSTASPLAANVFCKKGQAWRVRFSGREENTLLPSKGAAYLHLLLSKPGSPISAIELACRLARNPRTFLLGSAGEKIDQEALSAYYARRIELKEDREEAKSNHDVAEQLRIDQEIEAIEQQIREATGLRGQIRKDGDVRDRVRKAVGNAIRRAIREICKFDTQLAAHLKPPRLRCGNSPCYSPDANVNWET